MIKSFSLKQDDVEVLEKEAKRLGVSQSEVIRRMLQNSDTAVEGKKAAHMEKVFFRLYAGFDKAEKQISILSRVFAYVLTEEERKRIVGEAKKKKDYQVLDFLLKPKEGETIK